MRSLIWIGLLQALLMLVSLGRAKVLAVLLSAPGFGVVATIDQLVTTVVQMGMLGLPFVALKYMANANSRGSEQFRVVASRFAQTLLAFGAGWTIVVLSVLQWRPEWLGATLAPYTAYLKITAISIPATIGAIFTANALAAMQRPVAAVAINLVVAFVVAAAGVFGVIQSGLIGFFFGTAVAGVISLAGAALILCLGLGVTFIPSLRNDGIAPAGSPGLVPTTAGVYLALAFSAASMFAIRLTVLGNLGEAAAGLYHGGISIALSVGAILTTLANLYLVPILNRQSLPAEKGLVAKEFVSKIIFLLIAGALPVCCFPQTAMQVLYSPAFIPAAATLFLFVIWQCLFQIVYVYQQLLIGLDDAFCVAILALVGFGGSAIAAAVLTPAIGLIGAPLGLILGAVIYAVLIGLRLQLTHRVSVSTKVLMQSAWLLLIVSGAGLLFASGDEHRFTAIAIRLAFAATCLALTYVFFLRGQLGNWLPLRTFFQRAGR